MLLRISVFIYLSAFLIAGGNAFAVEAYDFTGISVKDGNGNPLAECQPGQQVQYEAAFSLERPGMALLHGTVTGSNWTQKLGYRARIGLKGAYTVKWSGTIPVNARGNARVEVVEYSPVLNERLVRTAFFTVTPFDAPYVGADACKGCHSTLYTAWQQTEHYPYVGCESCHGPGGKHVTAPSPATIIVDTTADLCKPCHSRNDGTVIEAQDEFIKLQQQYNEWVSTKHGKFLQCAGCHNPHYSLESAPMNAIKATCWECHVSKKRYLGMQLVACTSCHMAPAVKAADSTGIGLYRKGDTASHIWRIKTEAEPYQMFAFDGTFAVKDAAGPFLTLNFACLSCHNGLSARLYDFTSVQKTSTLVH